MKTFEKADRELSAGNLWRAKEILEGSLRNLGYDQELYERLGIVLLRMGDLPQAGKFLFLSGARKGEYKNSIAIYIDRYSAGGACRLLSTFPQKARLAALSDYPPAVQKELRELGLPEEFKRKARQAGVRPSLQKRILEWFTCLILAAALFGLLIAGFVKVVELISSS